MGPADTQRPGAAKAVTEAPDGHSLHSVLNQPPQVKQSCSPCRRAEGNDREQATPASSRHLLPPKAYTRVLIQRLFLRTCVPISMNGLLPPLLKQQHTKLGGPAQDADGNPHTPAPPVGLHTNPFLLLTSLECPFRSFSVCH